MPDLAACVEVFIDQADTFACGSSGDCRRQSSGSGTDDQDVEGPSHCVCTSMASSQRIWQLRRCGSPLIVVRHSKQMPIPQSGARGPPVTDVLAGASANASATA